MTVNGNIAALVNAADGSTSARYEYGPFAEPVRVTGSLAKANPFRFSTKWTDNEAGPLYYGYRYYNPTTGRWLSRDPIEEEGGRSLYAFGVGNALSHTKDNLDYRVKRRRIKKRQGNILRDDEIVLRGPKSKRDYPGVLRRVVALVATPRLKNKPPARKCARNIA
ncbi:MAG: RHS repeat-associated core domain-containing protein [Verrucomicrobia bacterium]|nr:RHS repeat-associated core domain-containing protein [Verrucomicrobiota bacterium]